MPFQASADYNQRIKLLNKTSTDEEMFEKKLAVAIKKKKKEKEFFK
jgi:hypothetical protein